MRRGILIIALVALLAVTLSCNRMPKDVIPPDKMENLLIDIHKSEAYIESDYAYYSINGRKDSIKNAVFAKHGVTRATFDTSLVWYGLNIEKYIQIYRNVIERLQEEDNNTLALMNDDKDIINQITRSGDTVNIWNREPCYTFEGRIGRNLLTFS
ncbi:MAG: DUF4296 domain-containing protein, partial [Bacteroidales bacterium]